MDKRLFKIVIYKAKFIIDPIVDYPNEKCNEDGLINADM